MSCYAYATIALRRQLRYFIYFADVYFDTLPPDADADISLIFIDADFADVLLPPLTPLSDFSLFPRFFIILLMMPLMPLP